MKNFLFYTLLAAMFVLPIAASAGEKAHAKEDCAKITDAAKKAECEAKHHEGAKH